MIRPALLVLLTALTAGAARAQDRPPTAPTRDVDILYQASAGGRAVEQRSRFAASVGKVRIDTPSPGLYLIVDRATHHMDMVSDGDRSVLEVPYDPARTVDGVPADRGFERLGADVIAGVPCTEWRTADRSGRPLALCMTEDGVLLRVRAGANVLVRALRVTYGPIDPAVFAIPASYQRHTKAPAR